ncbi:MAG: tRNA (adenosine(37)-N6)-threonylcarbamoyltransferase complex transferase subunit TsaD [Bdellovibrionota bacterium]
MSKYKILGIETSCDESSAAIVEYCKESRQITVQGLATFSQIGLHSPYGGVVPEVASRNHLETINQMVDRSLYNAQLNLKKIDAIAVTNRPGLAGALLVGVSTAKAIAYAHKKPLVSVHHLEGHAISIFLNKKENQDIVRFPLLILIVSGGHTNLYLANTPPEFWPVDFLQESLIGYSLDDAAGEAFDKTAKMLGFPYPGGTWIEKTARGGDPDAFPFPRALIQKDTLNFSFSGLKTSVALQISNLRKSNTLEQNLSDLCASIQEAIIDALLNKTFLAAEKCRAKSLAIVGGVASNNRLRERLANEWNHKGFETPPLFPDPEYCTDNAAMIAAAGGIRYLQGRALSENDALSLNVVAT